MFSWQERQEVLFVEELIDIYTDNYEYLGVAEKKIAHKKGLWHRVFTCVILNSIKSTIYLQKKRPNQYSFNRPDYLDISVGGHYRAGEQISDGIREVYEETGLSSKEFSFEDLIPIGIRQTASTISEEYIANEFQHIFLLDYRGKPEGLLRYNDESNGFIELSIDNTIDLLTCKTDAIKGQYYYL